MSETRIYLDYNATAPARPQVVAAVTRALAAGGNPSSVHGAGRGARRTIEEARAKVAALAGCPAGRIVFTSGGTEANNLAVARAPAASLIVSAVEHDSVLAPAKASGKPLFVCPVTSEGVVDLGALEALLAEAPRPALVCLMLANNETGAVQPVAEAAALTHAAGGLLHCDAIQALGKIPVDMAALGVDLMALSGHKIGAPAGVGALAVREGLSLKALLVGGGQELGRRAGTENVAGIAGFGVAAELAAAELALMGRIETLRDRMEARLKETAPKARVFSEGARRLPNTSCIAMPGVSAETQVMALDLEGVCVSSGAACSSGKVRASRVLGAMGASEEEAGSAIRISLGWTTTQTDVDRLVEAWSKLYRRTARNRTAA